MRKSTTLFVLAFMVLSTFFSLAPAVMADEETDDVIPFIYGSSSDLVGIDPLDFYDTTSADIAINHLEGLYAFDYTDPSMPQIPRLAADMGEWNTAGTEWTIPLRDDVQWQDGTPFTASDVVWNWHRLSVLSFNNTCEHASLWFNDVVYDNGTPENTSDDYGEIMFSDITAVDEHTVKFTLPKPWTDLALLQSFSGCFMIKPVTGYDEKIIPVSQAPDLIIGTGPFVFDSWTPGEKTVLVANDDYYRGRPDIDKLIFQVFADADAYNQALLNKEIHMCRAIRFDNQPLVEEDPDLSYHKQTGSCCFWLHLNVHNIPLAARKAMQYAFNYSYYIDVTARGQSIEHHSPVPEGMFGYNPDLDYPTYNVETARQYMLDSDYYASAIAAAGLSASSSDDDWKAVATGSTPLDTFNFTNYGVAITTQLMDNMQYIGLKIVDNQVGSWGSFLRSNLDDLEIVMGGWCPDYFAAINQIEPIYATGASSNFNGLNDTALDADMKEAHTLVGDELAAKIDEIVTTIIIDKAAAMYFEQSVEYIGYYSAVVKNPDDVFNASFDKYFYNVEFTLNDKPGIPGFAFWSLMVASLGAAAMIIRKRK
jgi:ABC-type transport system substrate-binding protein